VTTPFRKTGLAVLGEMAWGSHCCHFYQTPRDLLDTTVPYFKVGLENKEFCLWLFPDALTEARARRALRRDIADGDRYLADGSMEIVSGREWYLKGGTFSLRRVMRQFDEKLEQVSARGYAGMRVNGNAAWLGRKDWRCFSDYERMLDDSLAEKPMIVLCSYPLPVCGAAEILDVARTHQCAFAKRGGNWEVVEWRTPPTSPHLYETLTIREREVLRLAAEGQTNPEIANRLGISVRTVESHRASLMRKLGLRNQTDVVLYALQRGLLRLEDRRR
jgi:DNA-binding CsgD family transcriptional regulator